MRSSVFLAFMWSATALASPQAAQPAATSPATPAPAAPGSLQPSRAEPALTAIDVDELPGPCRELGNVAMSASKAQALSARISLASCLVAHETKPLVLCDCEQSVREVEAAMAPSLTLLDEVFVHGDPATQILARHAQGEMLSSFAARVLTTVPPPLNSSEDAIALRETRLQLLQPLIEPWQVRARAAFTELDRIARANPRLAKNVAVVSAVRASRARLAQGTQAARR